MRRFLIAFAALLFSPVAIGGVLMTQEAALKVAFPGDAPDRRTLYLTDADRAAIQKRARAKVDQSVVTYYVGKLADGSPGHAFFETHVVRTMPETFMTVVDAEGKVRFVELLAFYEPPDYQPPERWLKQFPGRELDDNLLVKRGIRNLTGATLTSQALTDGVRRALALWSFVTEGGAEGRKIEK